MTLWMGKACRLSDTDAIENVVFRPILIGSLMSPSSQLPIPLKLSTDSYQTGNHESSHGNRPLPTSNIGTIPSHVYNYPKLHQSQSRATMTSFAAYPTYAPWTYSCGEWTCCEKVDESHLKIVSLIMKCLFQSPGFFPDCERKRGVAPEQSLQDLQRQHAAKTAR
jgi:hypothetical protein